MAKLTNNNRLSIIKPKLCKEWDYDKNYSLKPEDVSYSSNKKVWWKCSKCKNEWFSRIKSRSGKNTIGDCPKCSHIRAGNTIKVCKNKNLVLANHKNIMKKWNFKKNKLDPNILSINSKKRVWWKCSECQYEWDATIDAISRGLSKCFKCRTMASRYPHLIKEWHFTKNKPLTPYNITHGYNKKVWWKCSKCSTLWQATPNNRGCNSSGCPECKKKIILKDGTKWDSLIEAYYHLYFKSKNIKYKHHGIYGGQLGRRRYDFYLIKENKYIEVTSFKKSSWRWKSYIKNIRLKKKFIKNTLKASFEFIQKRLTRNQIQFVKQQCI
jgi:DNA-directed RNA polymerase subunit RPC12/RpoP